MKNSIRTGLLSSVFATSAIALSLSLATPAVAQVTSSNINGQVIGSDSIPVSSASVTIVHVPTGAAKSTVTSSNGVFFASGLAVGGPYTVTVSSSAGNSVKENIYLQPSSNSLTIGLSEALDEIITFGTITAKEDLNGGVGSVFSDAEILGQPSTERDLIATLVRDPLAFSDAEGQLTVAGVNPRFNALAIDGSLQQDDFGLGSSTYATARSPISLDMIESASVLASEYSVTTSGFTGGLVNVVTKSGSNEIDGSLYYYTQDEDYFGNAAFDQFVDKAAFKEEEYGFTLRGPIIKDKLFFAASYDKFESGSGRNFTASDEDDGINPAIYSALNQIVQDNYGYDMGGRPDVVSLPVTSERILGKIDWNINDNHRASFTYQSTEEAGTSGVGQTTFQSAYYDTPTDLKAYTGQLFSDWNDRLSTEFRINFKDYERGQLCRAGDTVGAWTIELEPDDLVGTNLEGYIEDFTSFTGGCDRFRQGNTYADDRLQLFGVANYVLNDHFISVGAEFQEFNLENLFAQRSVGEFRYRSLTDLIDGTADRVRVQLPQSGNRDDILAAWGYNTLALFAQDSWQIRPDFRLDYGLRYETIIQGDEPTNRSFFNERYGFANTVNLDGNDLIMPRVSFEYQPFARTKLTGGVGLFGGGDPKVWTSNAFTPPVFFAQDFDVANTNPAQGTPQSLVDRITSNDANDPGPIDVISPDFETPSDWKASLRLDQTFDANFGGVNLGDDYKLSLQALYSATNKGFRWENLGHTLYDNGVSPDGRTIYADLEDLDINNAIALTNYNDGSSLTLSASLAKDFDNGLGFYASYAYQDVENTVPGGSSRGVSNWRGIIGADRNSPIALTSVYQTEHSFKVNVSYEKDILGDLSTRFNLFGQMYSGQPFYYTFDVNSDNALFGRAGDGESPFDNDLLYVPTITGNAISDPNVVLGSRFDEEGFINYVNERGLQQGQTQKNAFFSNWNQRWDFQIQQELPFFNKAAEKYVGENRLKFVLDIKNIANLLNDEWGTHYDGPRFDTLSTVRADLVSRADVTANGVDGASALEGDSARTTCTTADSCVYRFNSYRERDESYRNLGRSVYEIRAGIRYEF